MKKILAVSVILFFVLAAGAQVTDNPDTMSDTTQIHFMRHHNKHNATDSAFKPFHGNRGVAMSRFDHGNRMMRSHFFVRRGSPWAHNHLRYSPEQRKQIHIINENYRKNSQDLYRQDNLSLGAYKSKLLALQKDKKSKIQALMTTEQKNQIEKWKKQASEERQVRLAANLERMKIHLNLSDDQSAKLKSQQENFRSQIMAIHQNDNLLSYQKKDQIKALVAKRMDEMKTVLTPEQFSQFEKMHKQRMGERFERSSIN